MRAESRLSPRSPTLVSTLHIEIRGAGPRLSAVLLGHADPVGVAGPALRLGVSVLDGGLAREVAGGEPSHEDPRVDPAGREGVGPILATLSVRDNLELTRALRLLARPFLLMYIQVNTNANHLRL